MEEIPPSYSEAVSRDPWTLIAPYLPPGDLFSASLVSQPWNQIFTNVLWRDPTSHFIPANAGLGHAFPFSQFLQCIKLARLRVRELTHTLDLSKGSLSFTSSDLPAGWLLAILAWLPNIKSILGPDMPAPDAGSMLEISGVGDAELNAGARKFGLRLLDIKGSRYVKGASAYDPLWLRCLPNLIYFDLSATARDKGAHNLFNHTMSCELLDLEILKVRNLDLKDEIIKNFAQKIGTRIWSLDVRDNRLTDKSTAWLVDYCTLPPAYSASEESPAMTTSSRHRHVKMVDPEVEDQAWYIARQIKDGYLASDPSPYAHKGLTHLHISGNLISADGIIRLLRSSNLRVLDVGSLWVPSGSSPYSTEMKHIQAMSKLIPHINNPSTHRLSYLRIHHHLITGATILRSLACPPESHPSYPTPYQMASQVGNLRTLTLTDVPYISAEITSALLSFLSGCANHEHESWLARKTQNTVTKEEVVGTGKRHSCRLNVLQLEMTRRQQQPATSISITEDPDSDVFLRESQNDFSFFALDDPSAHSSEAASSSSIASSTAGIHDHRAYGEDVIPGLTGFRNERRAAHDMAAREGTAEPGTQDCWSGRVKIIR